MKCPVCGKWNRASLPNCFYCGAAMNEGKNTEDENTPSWQEQMAHITPAKSYIQVDEDGNQTPAADSRDEIAREMKDLQARKAKGEEEQERLRMEGISSGFASTSRNIQTPAGRVNPFLNVEKISDYRVDRPEDDSDKERKIDYDDYADYTRGKQIENGLRKKRSDERFGKVAVRRKRLARQIALILLFSAIAVFGLFLLWNNVIKGWIDASKKGNYISDVKEGSTLEEEDEEDLSHTVLITASVLDDMRAHTILIPAEEGSSIWIPELMQEYEVIGGYATVEVADYNWYSDESGVTAETVDVALTPYISTRAGEKKKMGIINYTVEVPPAELILISPDTTYFEAGSDQLNIRFQVDENATVYINGENYTSFINTNENGLVSFYANIQAIGNNNFHIVANCQYYRQNEVTLTIYRAPVSIDVHLDTTLSDRSINKTMKISGTTIAGANILILTPYENLDLSKMSSVGSFSFDAVFETIGNNDIKIQVSMPGTEPTVYTKTVYYLPPASEYSKLAWSMNRDYDYSDYLNLTDLRVSKTQVYVCKGTITEIISDSPQLAIMELSDTAATNGGTPRKVMLENQSTDTWVKDTYYRVYADAYGTYSSMPRLTVRYTYPK